MAEIIDDNSMLNVGTVLKNTYRIERHLSSGGFGNTYIAKTIEFGDIVAIKEFYISGINGRDNYSRTVTVSNTNQPFFSGQLEKFKKEARRLRSINHDNIVRVHDLFEENGTAYYVMDYIEGESFADMLKYRNIGFALLVACLAFGLLFKPDFFFNSDEEETEEIGSSVENSKLNMATSSSSNKCF